MKEQKQRIFVKSLEIDKGTLVTKTSNGTGLRQVYQTINDVLERNILEPNTISNYEQKRLCVSYPTEEYAGSYRPQGLIFSTGQNPKYAVPTDMENLLTAENEFLPNAEDFKFGTIGKMLKKYGSSDAIHSALIKKYPSSAVDKKQYNECCFFEDVVINPVALYGFSPEVFETAKKHNLPVFESVESFVNTAEYVKKNELEKNSYLQLFKGGAKIASGVAGTFAALFLPYELESTRTLILPATVGILCGGLVDTALWVKELGGK